MELKFLLLFNLLILLAVLGCIETKSGRGSSRGSSSRGSSSRGSYGGSPSSHRGSSSSGWGSSNHHGSSSSGWGSSNNHGSSSSGWGSSNNHGSSSSGWGSSNNHGSSSSGWGSSNNHGSPSSGWGSLNNRGSSSSGLGSSNNHGHSSSSSNPSNNRGGSSNTHITGSLLNSERNQGSSSSGKTNAGSATRPFGRVPPPRQTGHNTNSPIRPFGTVPPPRNIGPPKSAPPPPGFVLPGSVGHTRPSAPPITYPGNHKPPVVPTRPGSNFGHRNQTTGTGYIQPVHYPSQQTSPGSSSSGTNYARQPPYNPSYPGSNTRPPGVVPPGHVQQTHYPTQAANPGGSMSGANYPRQPPYNPAYPNTAPPFHSPYPVQHQPSFYSPYPVHHQPSYVQPSHTAQVYPQYTHSLPPNPAQTVVIVPGQTGGSFHRSTGDIFKEAIIHAGVNAAVNRITSPHHYYDRPSSSWTNYGTPPQGAGTVTSTNTHITNNNYYGEPPSATGNFGSGINNPPNNNGQFNANGGVQGGATNLPNTPGNYGSSGNTGTPGNYGSPGNTGIPGNYGTVGNTANYGTPSNVGSSGNPEWSGAVSSQVPSNGISSPIQNNGNGQAWDGYVTIWDQELMNITEKLFSLDENNAMKFISMNLQKQIDANNTVNITDSAPEPLFVIQPEAYNIPTIKAIRSLYQAAFEMENKTQLLNNRKEEALFVDIILNTNVMIAAMDFLAQKNLINHDYYEHKDMLKTLWFTPYDGSSSGFKRIFQGEVWEGILWGIQDWIAFDFYEKAGRANYLSYIQKTDLGNTSSTASILKTNFKMDGNQKSGTALFVGTSPELQIALYTICYYTRPNNYCDVSLGGTKFKIYTHLDRYFGKDLINVAFPIV